MSTSGNLPVLSFATPREWEAWLAKHHASSAGIWLRIYKKDTGVKSVTYAEALDEALCYGWIDGQKNSYDEASWVQKFTPRGPRSSWSKINTEHAERLMKAGRVKPAGMAAIEAAKKDGRWEQAYASQRNAAPPEDFLALLEKNKKAKAFYESLNKANVYAIVYRLTTAKKPETREKRLKMIMEMLKKGEKFHP